MTGRKIAPIGTGLALLALTHCGGDDYQPLTLPGGGASGTTGGVVATGGAPDTGGTGETATTGGAGATGGASGTGGAGPTGGMGVTGGANADVDAAGVPLASPGDSTSTHSDYLNLGEIRLLNNAWGSDERSCNTPMSVFVNDDSSVGWTFNRAACGGEGTQPDFPELEFGIHPFGIGDELETSPGFSSTTLLPLQISGITSASIVVDGLGISLQSQESWNISFEFWLSQRNPVSDPNPGVYAEILGMWGWQSGRWACGDDGNPNQNEYQGMTVTAGDKSYELCHQSDTWADGQWRYFQFRMQGGPTQSFSGRVDIKAFLDWVVSTRGYSRDLWVTRMEVGSEIDDNTRGTVTVRDVTFEVNGQSRSIRLAD